MKEIVSRVKKNNLELVVHPVAFREKRYVKTPAGEKIFFPTLTRDYVREANLSIKETIAPLAVLEGNVLFLGEIPRVNDFEEGMKNAFYEQDGIEKPDAIEDDSALVFNVKKKGLVILTGCAHSGIINTVNYAKELTGVENIFAVVGGLHLTGPAFSAKISPTIEALKAFKPDFIVPAHCTGRDAVLEIESKMKEQFVSLPKQQECHTPD